MTDRACHECGKLCVTPRRRCYLCRKLKCDSCTSRAVRFAGSLFSYWWVCGGCDN